MTRKWFRFTIAGFQDLKKRPGGRHDIVISQTIGCLGGCLGKIGNSGRVMIDPKSLAFDVDGVFADIMSLFIDIAREEYDIDGIRYNDFTCFALEDCLDIDPEIIRTILSQILDGAYAPPLKPIAGAPEVLTRLGRFCGSILFVTARPYLGPIYTWMQKILPLEPELLEIIATGSFEAKAEILVRRKISYFVEDRLETCYDLEAVGVTPVLFRQPWNREHHPFIEVDSWKQLESLIKFE